MYVSYMIYCADWANRYISLEAHHWLRDVSGMQERRLHPHPCCTLAPSPLGKTRPASFTCWWLADECSDEGAWTQLRYFSCKFQFQKWQVRNAASTVIFINLTSQLSCFLCHQYSKPVAIVGRKCISSAPIPVPTQIQNYQRMAQNLQSVGLHGSTRYVQPLGCIISTPTSVSWCLPLTMFLVIQGHTLLCWQQFPTTGRLSRIHPRLPTAGKCRSPTTTVLPAR